MGGFAASLGLGGHLIPTPLKVEVSLQATSSSATCLARFVYSDWQTSLSCTVIALARGF